jgi:hypothetical protein
MQDTGTIKTGQPITLFTNNMRVFTKPTLISKLSTSASNKTSLPCNVNVAISRLKVQMSKAHRRELE